MREQSTSSEYVEIPIQDRGGSIIAYAKVSPEDAAWVQAHSWSLKKSKRVDPGYVTTNIYRPLTGKRHMVFLHRMVLGIVDAASSVEGDHINGDPLDNRRDNLRIATRQQNTQNVKARSSSGYRGVYFRSETGKWRARVEHDGKKIHLGYYDSPEEAARVSDEWRQRHMTHYVAETPIII